MLDLTEPERDRARARAGLAEDLGQARQLDRVADRVEVPCASISVAGRRVDSPACAQARSTASRWPTGLGAVMPLPLPSLEPPMPEHHGVDPVAVALGVGQPLEHEQRRRPRP